MKVREFYESDWSAKKGAPPEVDSIFSQRTEKLRDALAPLLKSRSANQVRVLDASCGSGSFVRFFRSLGCEVVGADIAVHAAASAREANPQASFVAASAEEGLPFRGETFDMIWFGETLAHLFDGHYALSEFNRVLKRDGQLALSTPYHGLVKNVAIALFAFDTHYFPDNCRIRFYDRKGLDRSLKRAGLTPHLWSGIGRWWPLWKSFFVVSRKSGPPGPPPNRLEPPPSSASFRA